MGVSCEKINESVKVKNAVMQLFRELAVILSLSLLLLFL